MLSSLVGCCWTAGRRQQLLSSSSSRQGFVFLAAAFAPSPITTRFLAATSWKAEILRDNRKPKVKDVSNKNNRPAAVPRIVRRGTHLTSHKKRRDDTVLYRADRVLANRTGQSRKECFELLQQRRVFQVLGRNPDQFESSLILQVIPGPKTKIPKHAALRIDRKHDVPMPPPLLVVYHKPKWVLSVRRDPHGRPCLDHLYSTSDNNDYSSWFTQTMRHKETDSGDPDNHSAITFVQNVKEQLHPVGRLDYDTTGLLLFSSSGPLTQTLLHPKHAIEKEYVATVTGTVDEDTLRATLAAGVTTADGVYQAKLVSAEHFSTDQVKPYLEQVRAGLPLEYNQTNLQLRGYLDVLNATALTTVTLTVQEGKHRMVRRILANAGHPVVSLHRRRLGAIELGDDLPVGGVRVLTAEELQWARRLMHLESKAKRRAFLEGQQEKKSDNVSDSDVASEIRTIATGQDLENVDLLDEEERELREFKRRTLREAILEVYGNDDEEEEENKLEDGLDFSQRIDEPDIINNNDEIDEEKKFMTQMDELQNKRQQADRQREKEKET